MRARYPPPIYAFSVMPFCARGWWKKNAVFFFPPTRRCRCRNLLHAHKKKKKKLQLPAKKPGVTDQPIHFPKRVFPHGFYHLRVRSVRDILGELTNESLMTFQSLHQSSSRADCARWTKLILNLRYMLGMISLRFTRHSKVNGINSLEYFARDCE